MTNINLEIALDLLSRIIEIEKRYEFDSISEFNENLNEDELADYIISRIDLIEKKLFCLKVNAMVKSSYKNITYDNTLTLTQNQNHQIVGNASNCIGLSFHLQQQIQTYIDHNSLSNVTVEVIPCTKHVPYSLELDKLKITDNYPTINHAAVFIKFGVENYLIEPTADVSHLIDCQTKLVISDSKMQLISTEIDFRLFDMKNKRERLRCIYKVRDQLNLSELATFVDRMHIRVVQKRSENGSTTAMALFNVKEKSIKIKTNTTTLLQLENVSNDSWIVARVEVRRYLETYFGFSEGDANDLISRIVHRF